MEAMPKPSKLEKLRHDILNPWKMKAFMLANLPMGLLAGLRVTEFTDQAATVTIPFRYLTKNPFRSIYFACLSMAAELASGAQGLVRTMDGSPVAMLVVGLEGEFTKKATGLIAFRCEDGEAIAQAIAETRATGEPRVVACTSTGRDAAGDVVAVFKLTWSFKARGPAAT